MRLILGCRYRLSRPFTIILLRAVAPRGALAPGFRFRKIYRHLPVAESHGISHHLRLIGTVYAVAELATYPPFPLVDMQIVKIVHTVPKAR